jgi:hypothetical protein
VLSVPWAHHTRHALLALGPRSQRRDKTDGINVAFSACQIIGWARGFDLLYGVNVRAANVASHIEIAKVVYY